MNKKVILLIVVSLSSVSFMVGAADAAEAAAENARLRDRVEKLDKEVEELKKALSETEQQSKTPQLHPILSNLNIQLYGYIKLDAAYDTSQTDDGNFAKWVEREDLNADDDQFNMTANQSRFGIRIKGTGEEAMQTSGRAEVDFYGGGSQNKAHLMMRHAYMKLDWPDARFSIIAGQTSDVISPLVPTTVNYSVAWWVGNIGYRRPQIRLTKVLGFDSDGDLTLEGAIARSIGRDDAIDATESGEDSGRPTLQCRASVTAPMFCDEPTTIGLSGHYANEEYDVTATGSDKDFRSWSMNLDFLQPLNDWLTIRSELFTGENLNAYLGGIGQGVTLSGANMYDEIGSSGGWIAASLGPWSGCRYNIGISTDDVDGQDVNAGARTLNRAVFANMFCSLNKNAEFALELSHWRTEYEGPGDADNFRVQTAFIYKF
jgi:hypothetical protein